MKKDQGWVRMGEGANDINLAQVVSEMPARQTRGIVDREVAIKTWSPEEKSGLGEIYLGIIRAK